MRNSIKTLFAAILIAAAGLAHAAPVNINTADAATLAKALTGVGQARAEAIVTYRTVNGPFKKVDDLVAVDGIGTATLEKNRSNLTVGDQ